MLDLSRRQSESVLVGDDDLLDRVFKVTVIEIAGGRGTLGFEIDEGIPIHPSRAREGIMADADKNGEH